MTQVGCGATRVDSACWPHAFEPEGPPTLPPLPPRACRHRFACAHRLAHLCILPTHDRQVDDDIKYGSAWVRGRRVDGGCAALPPEQMSVSGACWAAASPRCRLLTRPTAEPPTAPLTPPVIEAISHLIHRDYEVGVRRAWAALRALRLSGPAAACRQPRGACGLCGASWGRACGRCRSATPHLRCARPLRPPRPPQAIVEDFVTLQFIAPGTDLKPILPALANVFDQALAGGGAKNSAWAGRRTRGRRLALGRAAHLPGVLPVLAAAAWGRLTAPTPPPCLTHPIRMHPTPPPPATSNDLAAAGLPPLPRSLLPPPQPCPQSTSTTWRRTWRRSRSPCPSASRPMCVHASGRPPSLPACLPACLGCEGARPPACLPACLPACPPACLPACLPAWGVRAPARPPACLPACLPACPPACLPARPLRGLSRVRTRHGWCRALASPATPFAAAAAVCADHPRHRSAGGHRPGGQPRCGQGRAGRAGGPGRRGCCRAAAAAAALGAAAAAQTQPSTARSSKPLACSRLPLHATQSLPSWTRPSPTSPSG